MLKLSILPSEISCNERTSVTLRLINYETCPLTRISFTIRMPLSIHWLGGSKRIEIPRLGKNEVSDHRLSLRATETGTIQLTIANLSYYHPQKGGINESFILAVDLTVKPALVNKRTVETSNKGVDEQAKHKQTKGAKPQQHTILFLASDPTNVARLRLGKEFDEIYEALQSAGLRDKFILKSKMSVRTTNIIREILHEKPTIIHFAGHGLHTGELCFENEQGLANPIAPNDLTALFARFADKVNCILLNACYSTIQARAISQHIQYVIGMSEDISDVAALAFVVGFYQALGEGESVPEAYEFGCVQIRLQGESEYLKPVLMIKHP